jgi:hypothetical protein
MNVKKCLLVGISALALLPVLLWAGPQVGAVAPSFTLPDTAGINHSLADYRGKVVHMLFWQST